MRKITSLNEDMETLRKSKADTERLVTTSKARIGSLEKEKDGLSKEKNVVKQVGFRFYLLQTKIILLYSFFH